jgi:hypothetical protein
LFCWLQGDAGYVISRQQSEADYLEIFLLFPTSPRGSGYLIGNWLKTFLFIDINSFFQFFTYSGCQRALIQCLSKVCEQVLCQQGSVPGSKGGPREDNW